MSTSVFSAHFQITDFLLKQPAGTIKSTLQEALIISPMMLL